MGCFFETFIKIFVYILIVFPFCMLSEVAADQKKEGLKSSLSGKSANNEPVLIKSETLNLDSKTGIFTYRGNVHVVKGDLDITTDVLVGKYSDQQELENILCRGNVVVTRAPDMRATSNRAFYNVKSAKIELTEEPELNRGGNIFAADKRIVFVNAARSEAEGNVRVKVLKTEGVNSGGKTNIKSKMNKQKDE